MDSTDLEKISQAKFELNTVRRNLREIFSQQLIFVHQSSFFKATPELISFLNAWDSDLLVVEDLHGNPVEVDRTEMLKKSRECYDKASVSWFSKYSDLGD